MNKTKTAHANKGKNQKEVMRARYDLLDLTELHRLNESFRVVLDDQIKRLSQPTENFENYIPE